MTRLSIVLTNFNHAPFLEERISSILSQMSGSDELVIIDDASKDQSVSIIQTFVERDPRIRFLQNAYNLGPAKSANIATLNSKGTYFCWLASDDILLPGFVDQTLHLLEKHPSIGIACSNYVFTYQDLSILYRRPLIKGVSSPWIISESESAVAFRKTLLWVPGHTSVMKRELVIKYGLFQDRLGPYCDWFIVHAISLMEGVIYIPQDLAVMRQNPASYSGQATKNKTATRNYQKAVFSILEEPQNRELMHRFKKSSLLRYMIRSQFWQLILRPKYWGQLFLFCLASSSLILGKFLEILGIQKRASKF